MSSIVISDSEGWDISFRAEEIEIEAPLYKATENQDSEDSLDEFKEIESLIKVNTQLCYEIMNELEVKKSFLFIKKKSNNYIAKLKKLNQIPGQKDENYNQLVSNIEKILDLLYFKEKKILDHSIFELAVLSNCFSQKNYEEIKKFTVNKSAELLGVKIREFCGKVFNHTDKTQHFTELEKTVKYVCEHLIKCIVLIKKN